MTIRRYEYTAVIRQTKRTYLLLVPHRTKLVRVPKKDTEFVIDHLNRKVVLVEERVADFIGLTDEVTL
jgi:hypothetical protein